MKTLLARLKAPTPAFWRKVQVRGAIVGTSLAGTAALPGLPPLLSTACTYAAFACGIAVAVAQATCDTPPTDSETPV
jgi:hypothetical protein